MAVADPGGALGAAAPRGLLHTKKGEKKKERKKNGKKKRKKRGDMRKVWVWVMRVGVIMY